MKFFIKIEPMKADESVFIEEVEEGKPFNLNSSLYNSGFIITIYSQRTT